MLTSLDFKLKMIERDKKRSYVMIQRSIHQEEITSINIYTPNIGACKYIKQISKKLKGKTNSNTIIVGDFNITLSAMDRSSRQRINKETVDLNYRPNEHKRHI